MNVVAFPPRRPSINDNGEEEIAVCAHCKNAAIIVIVADGVARFECVVCKANLTEGILPLCHP